MLKDRGYVVDVNPKEEILTQKQLIKYLQKKPYDAVITLLTDHIDTKVFDSAPSVKIYSNYATGYDNFDTNEAKKRLVVMANAPAPATSEAVAEHVLAMTFALATKIVEADNFVRAGKYRGWEPMNFIGTDLLGKTFGLVGAGRIGERVAKYVSGFGLKVVYTDLNQNEKIEKEYGAVYYKSLGEILPIADFISLHVPLLDSTKHLINEKTLGLMKSTSFLINTSRGPVVDESALCKALKNKIIAGAALDVFEFEPKTVSGLTKLKNIILTPHIASASLETRNQMSSMAAQNIIDFFEGKFLDNVVNK